MKWDYIVIGAGSAGCAVAHELVKAGRTVLVVEAGGGDRSPFIKIPAGLFRACAKYDWGYRAQPDPSRGGAEERWIRGKVLGGSSSINGTVYVRGAAEDFDRWSQLCGGAGGWSAGEVMAVFRALETSDQSGPLRGHTGPLHVRTVRRPHLLTRKFIESAVAAGYPFNEDYNGARQEGVGYVQLSQRRGLRCSASDAFLKPLLGQKNLTLRSNSRVQRVEFAQNRATAVSFWHQDKLHRETAGDIILCAGAIDSPKILMLSGIGDSRELKRHGIDTVFDLPAVGLHFKEHPLLRLTYRTRIASNNPTEGLLQKLGIAARFALYGEGPISNLFEVAAFLKSSPAEPSPDIKLHFLTLGYTRMSDGSLKLAPHPAVTVSLSKSYSVSSGRISLTSANPADPPIIECPLLESRADVDTMIQGIQTVRRIMKSEPIASLVVEETNPGAQIQSPEELEAFVRGHTGISYHSIGTCRMGIGEDAVVGPDLRVRGTENLWVADASIMPDHISGNTNAVCMMIGAKLGQQLVGKRQP